MSRRSSIQRVLWVVLAANLAVAAAKLTIGFGINSLAMTADGFHSLLDGISNVVGLVGISVATRPPDADHQYGHQKYEAFAALGISLLLGITAFEVVRAGISRMFDPSHPEPTLAGLAVMAVTIAVNIFISRYEARQGRQLNSEILLADSAHTRSDVFVSLSVIVGLGAVWLEIFWFDILVAFMIAGLIIFIAYGVLRRVSTELTDTASLKPEEIEKIVLAVPDVISCSHIRSRGTAPHLFIDLEVQLDPDLPLWKAHRLAHVVMDRCLTEFEASDVIVHAEPAEARHHKQLAERLARARDESRDPRAEGDGV